MRLEFSPTRAVRARKEGSWDLRKWLLRGHSCGLSARHVGWSTPNVIPSNRISGLQVSRLFTLLSVTIAVAALILVSPGVASAQSYLDVLHAFTSLGEVRPQSALIQATDGNFYGTSSGGLGTVFQMTPSGTVTILHAFTGGTT